ncbi:MarR family winged helix-turn-helix transcriptional regulator [Phenylobacterium sp.]|uniref:MarR family winged helix-turn-helix transcriptional regulator n=1 Tax=Phenylobacterium sp. TaxID=1871053 RepID=UPI0027369A8D|nr:MarR family transcriptional regulator [Phenylobacterium sp.]MDP3658869.1 MarR family transcriptional regulator [Phenylobacterium sp.]
MPPAPQDRADIQVFREVTVISQIMREVIGRRLPAGMTHAQFDLLARFVRHGDGETPAELARATMVTKGAVTNTLQRMEAKGFVAVLADVGDRRKKRVRVTRTGLAAYNAAVTALRGRNEAVRGAFTDDEFLEALPFLKALRVFLEELVETPAREAASH